MQDNLQTLQAAVVQPWVKLTQSNMELLARFAVSPEMVRETMANAQSMLEQGQKSAANLAQSGAFAHLTQGFMRNYIEFATEVSQTSMAALVRGQTEMLRFAQDAGTNAVAATARAQR